MLTRFAMLAAVMVTATPDEPARCESSVSGRRRTERPTSAVVILEKSI
jgi:hypothetical protein